MAGKKPNTSTPRLNQAQIQTSTYGVVIPFVCGTSRVSPNLIEMGPLQSTTNKSSSGGKGGGSSSTSYNYSAWVIMGVCGGPIGGIYEVFKDSSQYVDGTLTTRYSGIASALTAIGSTALAADYTTLSQTAANINTGSETALASAGLSLAPGTLGQAPQSFVPSDSVGYSLLAYLYSPDYALSSSATIPNHSVTVTSEIRAVVNDATLDDAEAADLLTAILEDQVPTWPLNIIGDMTEYRASCRAYGIFLSITLDSQTSASSVLDTQMQASNAEAFWSECVLKVRTYADTAKTGNGAVFTPDLTPTYSFTDDNYMPDSGDDPVQVSVISPQDAYNYVQIQYQDRTHQYNTVTLGYGDTASIVQFGEFIEPAVSLDPIKMPSVALTIAQLRVQRLSNVWETYTFKVGPAFCRLEPMDRIEITDSVSGLVAKLALIKKIDENADGTFTITAEEMLVGASHPPLVTQQTPLAVRTNYDVAPGSVESAVLLNPSLEITTGGDTEAWIAVAGGPTWGGADVWVSLDGSNYTFVDTIKAPSIFGKVTAVLNSGSDPDTTNTLSIDLTESLGALESTSTQTADADGTLCYVGSELVSFANATLTGSYTYNLTYLRRGLYGTTNEAHNPGEDFVRLDNSIFKYAYNSGQIGATIYVKFCSFNPFGRAKQLLSEVEPFTIVLNPNGSPETDLSSSLDNLTNMLLANTLRDAATASSQATFNFTSTGLSTQQVAVSASTSAGSALSQLSTMGSVVDGAFVLNETTVKLDADTSLASWRETVNSVFGSGTVTIEDLQTALNGQTGRVTNIVNSNGVIVGNDFGTSGVEGSGFYDIMSPNFRLIDNSTGNAVVPFAYSDGLLTLTNTAIHGDLIVEGTISTEKITINGVTVPTIVAGSSAINCDGTDKVMLTGTITVTEGCLVYAAVSMKPNFSSGAKNWTAKLQINGTDVYDATGTAFVDSMSMSGALDCPSGIVTVTATFNSDSTVSIGSRTLFVIGYMR